MGKNHQSPLFLLLSIVLLFALSGINAYSDHHSDHHGSVNPDTALGWLKNGNIRYLNNKQRNDGKSAHDRIRLTKGQHPHTIILSCSDSRVPPELIFDQALGEIFVIRVAGEALDSSVIGSIEYAVEHLHSKLIFIMGHSECGAVKASINTPPDKSAGSPSIDRMVADIRPRLPASAQVHPSEHLVEESAANARKAATELVSKSRIIENKINAGQLKIASGLYHLDSGKVDFH